MNRTLPNRPNLKQLKKQAKDLRNAHKAASPDAATRIQQHLPRLSKATPDEILKGKLSLQEAQHVIACEYGCKSWQMLSSVVAGDLNTLAGLSDEHIQVLLREADQKDFTLAFLGAGAIVSQRFLSNMSERVRKFVGEEMEAHADIGEEERGDARRVILTLAAQMAADQRIEWPYAGPVADMDASVERGDFDLLANLENATAQTLMREVDQKDLVEALLGAAPPVCERFLGQMSPRVRGFVESEMELSKAPVEQSESARRKVLAQTGGLAVRGMLQWPANGITPELPAGPQYSVPDALLALVSRPLDELTSEEVIELWTQTSLQAREHGILSLEPVAAQTVDPFPREALQLLVDGTGPALIQDILDTRLRWAILPQQRTRCAMVIEAVMCAQSGDNPGLIRHKLGAIYQAQPEETAAGTATVRAPMVLKPRGNW